MDVIERLDAACEAVDVLKHPFYVRWSEGSLGEQELALYAGEYRHAVVALAEASAAAAACSAPGHAAELERHAEEERAHVSLWDDFASACGTVANSSQELRGTRECARSWTAGEDLLEHLAVLYAIEAGQPQISATKLEGLREHYRHVAEGPATEYFRLHEHRDVEHARAARELIRGLMSESADANADAERMVARAQAALNGNWLLLDDVEAAAA